MDLLSFAKGPILQISLCVLLLGVCWRSVGILALRGAPLLSPARRPGAWKGLRLTALRSWPRPEFRGAMGLEIVSYAFHLCLFAAVLLYAPHVLFIGDIVAGALGFNPLALVGLAWPTLSGQTIFLLGSVGTALLLAVFVHRLASPVKRLISTFDDYLSWFLTITPLASGLLAYGHYWIPYQTMLAVHILSVEALMIWFPFGKLFHPFTMFVARGVTGVLFERKGAAL